RLGQLRHLAQLAAGFALADRRYGPHPRRYPPRCLQHIRQCRPRVEYRRGVGHAAERSEATACRRSRARSNRLFGLEAWLAQMDVQVHEAGGEHPVSRQLDNHHIVWCVYWCVYMATDGLDGLDALAADEESAPRIEAQAGVNDARAAQQGEGVRLMGRAHKFLIPLVQSASSTAMRTATPLVTCSSITECDP